VGSWNGHPIDVSPARYLLKKLGFVERKRKYIYDGTHAPDEDTLAMAEREMPQVFEREGKEKAPVDYDAEWVISRSPPKVQGLLRRLIEFLQGILPGEYEFACGPRGMDVLYRGVWCIHPRIGQKKIWLRTFQRGWHPGMVIDAGTDFEGNDFLVAVLERLERARQLIDRELDGKPEQAADG
jgi:hypothetical protein